MFSSGRAEPPPNLLLIVSDDQGYNDLGILGNGILTPTLDRLATEGVRLTNFYVAWPACTPSRGAFLNGRYPQRNGIYDMIRNEAPDYGHRYSLADYEVTFERIGGMDLREVILPQMLKSEGYRSGIYGKWDLGTLTRFLPTSRGFDDFYGFVNTGIDYYTHERYGVPSMYRNLEPTEDDRGTYCTELFVREAMRFLGEQPADQPFFLYLPFNAPHNSSALEPEIRSSVQAPDEFKAMYPPVATEFREGEKYGQPARLVTRQARVRDYRAAVTAMDDGIGQVMEVLEERGDLDNTIIVFFSDNGGSGGADNRPLRGKKGTMWEGGLRVPCIVHWPTGNLPAGSVCEEFLTSLDVLPSFLSAARVTKPKGVVLDGYDWWEVLKGNAESPREEMFWQRRAQIGARVGPWKWVVEKDGVEGFFHLDDDPGETNDLSQSRPDELAMVKERYARWVRNMEEAEPRGPFRNY